MSVDETLTAQQYDAIAEFYDSYLSRPFADAISGPIGRLLASAVGSGAHILDACCGTGHVANALLELGYRVDAIDASARMVDFARVNAAGACCWTADVRDLGVAGRYDAVISTYNSLNHLLTVQDFSRAARSVRGSLKDGGAFIFDALTIDGMRAVWNTSYTHITENQLWATRAVFDESTMRARAEATAVWPWEGTSAWKRADVIFELACHEDAVIREALEAAGFSGIRCRDHHDVGLGAEHTGRVFYIAVGGGSELP